MSEPSVPIRPEFLLEHAAWVRRLAGEPVAEAATADDLAQQTLLTALERPPSRGDHPRAWLATVARSIAGRFKRSSERRLRHESNLPPPRGDAAAIEVVARANLQRVVVESVLALDEPYRSTILMRYFEDLEPREVAERLDVPIETVRTRLKRGLALLRARLAPKLGGERDGREGWVAALSVLAQSRPVAATTAALSVGGALLVATKLKLLVAATLLVVTGFAIWKFNPTDPPSRHENPVTAGAMPFAETSPADAPPLPDAATAPPPVPTREALERAAATSAPAPTEPTTRPSLLHGVVRDENGVPVANAAVLLQDAAPFDFKQAVFAHWSELLDEARAGQTRPPMLSVVTSDDGTFTFSSLPHDGTWNVAAVHREAGFVWRPDFEIDAAAAPLTLDLTLEPGFVVSGIVTDETGLPLADARVVLGFVFRRTANGGTWSSSLSSVKTGADGRYESEPTPARDLRVHAERHGYFRSPSRILQPPPRTRSERVDFQLIAGRIVAGRLLDPRGVQLPIDPHDLSDFAVLGTSEDPLVVVGRPKSKSQQAEVAEEGTYGFAPVEPDVRFVAVYCREQLLGSTPLPSSGPGPDVTIDFGRLPKSDPTGTFSTFVKDAATGVPITTYMVRFHRGGDTWGRGSNHPDGRFTSQQLAVGHYEVSVSSSGYGPASGAIDVRASDLPAELTFALLPADSRIEGFVTDANGAPLPRVRVFLGTPDGEASLTAGDDGIETDSRGGFLFEELARGDYVVVAVEDSRAEVVHGFAPASARVAARGDAAPVELRMAAGVMVRIAPAVTPPGDDVDFSFRLRDQRGAWVIDDLRGGGVRTQSGPGPFGFLVAPGQYTVEVHADGCKTGRADFTATSELVVPVELLRADR